MKFPQKCEMCDHPLVFFPEYSKSFCPVCEKERLERFSDWLHEQEARKIEKQRDSEPAQELEQEIRDQEHIHKLALKAVLEKNLEESLQHKDDRPEYFEGKIDAYQELLRLILSDTAMVDENETE